MLPHRLMRLHGVALMLGGVCLTLFVLIHPWDQLLGARIAFVRQGLTVKADRRAPESIVTGFCIGGSIQILPLDHFLTAAVQVIVHRVRGRIDDERRHRVDVILG